MKFLKLTLLLISINLNAQQSRFKEGETIYVWATSGLNMRDKPDDIYAQNTEGYGFAIINDKDGYTNVRGEPNAQSKIVGKIKEGELFHCFGDESHKDWFSVSFNGNNGFWGYVHKSRITFVEEFPKLKQRKAIKDTLYINNDSIQVKIISNRFQDKKHKITRREGSGVVKIDGKKPWGVDGGLPNKGINKITLQIGDTQMDVPLNALNDLFQPNFDYAKVYIAKDDTIYITMLNSDGAGGYAVAFVFKDKEFQQRYVFYGF
jgi:hypothetical protein